MKSKGRVIKMNSFLQNVWAKRVISLINLAYVAVIAVLTYATFLYDLEFKQNSQFSFLLVYVIASAVFLTLMILTKDEFITKIIGVLLPPLVFLFVLFNLGDWVLIIPAFIVAIVIFFAASNHETLKVILGTVYLLIYVLGLIIFFVINFLFGGSSVETRLDSNLANSPEIYSVYAEQIDDINRVNFKTTANTGSDSDFEKDANGNYIDNTISPDGKMQFYIADVQDNNVGKIALYVIPYGQDKNFKFFSLKQKGVKKTVYNFERGEVPLVAWKDNNTLEYKAKGSSKVEETYVVLPEKNYFEFLGIS